MDGARPHYTRGILASISTTIMPISSSLSACRRSSSHLEGGHGGSRTVCNRAEEVVDRDAGVRDL